MDQSRSSSEKSGPSTSSRHGNASYVNMRKALSHDMKMNLGESHLCCILTGFYPGVSWSFHKHFHIFQ